MKLLFDFFPVLLFFITYKLHDDMKEGIVAATAVIIAATIVQVGTQWFREKKIEKTHLITLVLVVVFGGITIMLEDERYIQWKVSAVNWLFAIVFLGSHFIGEKTIVERMMGKAIQVPAHVWTRLNLSWVLFFLSVGIINVYIMYQFDLDTWVDFKFYGVLGLTLAFVFAQAFYLNRYVEESSDQQQPD